MSELVKRLHDAENLCNKLGFSGSARAIFDARKRITELEASLADAIEAQQVLGLKLAHAEGHSANTVVGPTPGAASACEQPLNDNAQKEAS